jgi:hypothetical protein
VPVASGLLTVPLPVHRRGVQEQQGLHTVLRPGGLGVRPTEAVCVPALDNVVHSQPNRDGPLPREGDDEGV